MGLITKQVPLIDLKGEYGRSGNFDMVFENGGFAIEDTFNTPIAAALFTDAPDYSDKLADSKYTPNYNYGNTAWNTIAKGKKPANTIGEIISIYTAVLNSIFVASNCFDGFDIDVDFIGKDIVYNIDIYKDLAFIDTYTNVFENSIFNDEEQGENDG
jgi:hypothetical protein